MRRTKKIGERLGGPGLLKSGDVVAIPVGKSQFAYARKYWPVSLGILDITPTPDLIGLEKIKKHEKPVLFMEYCEPIDHPDWIFLGKWEFESQEASASPKVYVEDVIKPGTFRILDRGKMYAATKEEVAGLEKHGLKSPSSVRKRIEEHFSLVSEPDAAKTSTPVSADAGDDESTPFRITDLSTDEGSCHRLLFADWDWLHAHVGSDSVDGYYLNGSGVEGLVRAAMLDAGIQFSDGAVEYNSEGDVCCIEFENLHDANAAMKLAQRMFDDSVRLRTLAAIARREGFGD